MGNGRPGSVNSNARISDERYPVPSVNNTPNSTHTAPSPHVWTGTPSDAQNRFAVQHPETDSYRPTRQWVVASPQPVDRHALNKFFSQQERLDQREAKLNQQGAKLASDKLKSGARVSNLQFKENKLAEKRAKLAAERKRTNLALEDEARRKPCKQKNCVQCPDGQVMGKNGCVGGNTPQEVYSSAYCGSSVYPGYNCGLYSLYARNCSGIRTAMLEKSQQVDLLKLQAQSACSAGAQATCNALLEQLKQEQEELQRLLGQLRQCQAGFYPH